MIIPSNNLLGFPLDSSQIGYHDDGLPAYSQEYTSSDYRIVLDKLISTGVMADEDSQSLKPSIASGQTSKTAKVRIKTGAAVIVGGFAINKSDTDINIVAPEIQGSETSRTKTTYIYIQKFDVSQDAQIVGEEFNFVTNESTSSGNTILEAPPSKNYALCLARVVSRTTKSGTSYLYQHTVTDLRASEYCGWAAPFVDVDTSAYYDAVQQVVEESKAEVEATIPTLLENAQDSVDSAIAELEEQTQTAVDLAQSAIEGTVAGELDSKIESLTDGLDSRIDGIENKEPAYLNPIVEIPANADLNDYKTPGSYFCKRENITSLKNRPGIDADTTLFLYVSVGDGGVNNPNGFSVVYRSENGNLEYTKYRGFGASGNQLYNSGWLKTIRGSIYSGDISNSAITTQKLADGSVTEDKLADELENKLATKKNKIWEGNLESGTISVPKIGEYSVVAVERQGGLSYICSVAQTIVVGGIIGFYNSGGMFIRGIRFDRSSNNLTLVHQKNHNITTGVTENDAVNIIAIYGIA